MPKTLYVKKNTFPCMFQNVKVEKLVKFQAFVLRMVFLSTSETLWCYHWRFFPTPVHSNGYCIIQKLNSSYNLAEGMENVYFPTSRPKNKIISQKPILTTIINWIWAWFWRKIMLLYSSHQLLNKTTGKVNIPPTNFSLLISMELAVAHKKKRTGSAFLLRPETLNFPAEYQVL